MVDGWLGEGVGSGGVKVELAVSVRIDRSGGDVVKELRDFVVAPRHVREHPSPISSEHGSLLQKIKTQY